MSDKNKTSIDENKMCKNISREEELANSRIENARNRISTILCMLQATRQELKWACESMEWDEEIIWDIEEASMNLGFVLGHLHNWDKDISHLVN